MNELWLAGVVHGMRDGVQRGGCYKSLGYPDPYVIRLSNLDTTQSAHTFWGMSGYKFQEYHWG